MNPPRAASEVSRHGGSTPPGGLHCPRVIGARVANPARVSARSPATLCADRTHRLAPPRRPHTACDHRVRPRPWVGGATAARSAIPARSRAFPKHSALASTRASKLSPPRGNEECTDHAATAPAPQLHHHTDPRPDLTRLTKRATGSNAASSLALQGRSRSGWARPVTRELTHDTDPPRTKMESDVHRGLTESDMWRFACTARPA